MLEAIQAGTAFNVANILDYGAVAGGSAGGNTTAILAAFAAADHIYAPPGIFAVDNDLTFPDGKVIHFFGAGPGKTFILTTAELAYTPGNGGAPKNFKQVPDQTQCAADSFFISNGRVYLCPASCTTVQADPGAKIDLLLDCNSVVG